MFWGTDSVWHGSPEWQIEAFRRLEIPEDMQKKHGFAPLGPADSTVKSAGMADIQSRLGRGSQRADLTRDSKNSHKCELVHTIFVKRRRIRPHLA